jgi:Transposase IS66 family
VIAAPAPERPIDGGTATEAMVVHVLVSKFCDSLALYRQAQMLARQGMILDRSTLSNGVGCACWWLTPLFDLAVGTVLSSTKLFADDTTLPVLDPGRGRTKHAPAKAGGWVGYGATRSTTGHGAAPRIRRRPMCIPRTAKGSSRRASG